MKRVRSYFRLVPIVIILLSACSENGTENLRIGSSARNGYEMFYLARDIGYYENARVRLVEMTSSSQVMRALRNGFLDGAALTLDEVLQLLSEGVELSIVLVIDYSEGSDVILAKPGIDSVSELKGKKIAVESAAVGGRMLDALLLNADMNAKDIDIYDCDYDNHLRCYEDSDAVISFEPGATKIRKMGAIELIGNRDMPLKIVDVLAVTNEAIRLFPGAINQVINGYFRSLVYLEKNKQEAFMRMGKRLRLPSEDFEVYFHQFSLQDRSENIGAFGAGNTELEEEFRGLAESMYKRHILNSIPLLPDRINSKFVEGQL